MRIRTLLAGLAAVALFGACDRNITYTEENVQPATCFECHSDQDTKLVAAEQQYAFSVHASGTAVSEPNDPCSGCHTSEGFVERIETGVIPASVQNPTAINCFTCHAPHTRGDLSRRVEAPMALANGVIFDLNNGNLCVACHQARRDVDTYVTTSTGRVTLSRRWGPHHSVQGDMLIGTNGYEYAGYTYEQTGHKGATDNGCLDCHYKVTENLRVGGHSFNMAYDDGTGEILNVGACEGCHPDIGDDFDYSGVQTDTGLLAVQLRDLLVAGGLLNGTTYEPLTVETSSDSAGAVWNYLMAVEDRSEGIHNRGYIQSLLQSAIDFLGAPASAPLAVREEDVPGGSR